MWAWLYNSFFILALPVLLAAWAARTGAIVDLPAAPRSIAPVLAVPGAALMVWAVAAFMIETGRVPSNAAPPARRAIGGPYYLFSDPIYIGAVLLAFGVFAWTGSASGVWLVAPALAFAVAALVFGREASIRPPLELEARRSLLALPEGSDGAPTPRQRVAAVLHMAVFVLAAELLRFMSASGPAPPWAFAVSVAAIAVTMAPVWTRSVWTLRKVLIGWWSAGVILLVLCAGPAPLVAPWSALCYGAMAGGALLGAYFERTPARALVGLAAVAALASLAPRHYFIPAAFAVLAASALPLHAVLLRLSETIANSWSALRLGSIRIINYAAYAFAGAALGAGVFVAVVGDRGPLAAVIIGACVVVSAGLWGQLVEFSGKLARPFGYYGALIGAFVGVAAAAALLGVSPWLLGAGLVLGAPAAQALGRLRCLVQGCCHGRLAYHPSRGITYRRAESRVLRIAKLGNQPIHPTPLYSIYANAFVMLVLVRMFAAGAPQTQLIGVYLLLSGGLRFVEEAYRGEPQTPIWRGLKLYQWLALGQALVGVLFTLVDSAPLPALAHIAPAGIAAILAVGSIAGFAMGVDFPSAKRRFSQLTPTDL